MATRPGLSRFTEQLLAPLPADATPANDPAFMRQIRKDLKAAWHPVYLKFEIARHYRDAARTTRAYAHLYGTLTPKDKAEGDQRDEDFTAALDNLMETPAPTKADLKIKIGHRRYAGGCPEWDQLIEADRIRLAA